MELELRRGGRVAYVCSRLIQSIERPTSDAETVEQRCKPLKLQRIITAFQMLTRTANCDYACMTNIDSAGNEVDLSQ